MSVSGDFASNTPPKGGGIPRWLIIVGVIVALLCALVGLFVCLSPVILSMIGPSIGTEFSEIVASLGCETANPDLPSDECIAWVEDVSQNNPEALEICTTATADNDPSTNGATAMYECLIDQGISPP